MSGVRPRGLPLVPGISRFLELNVRTYVRHRGQPGVTFFSLDASLRLGVGVARWIFHLPYFYARMRLDRAAGEAGVCRFESQRCGAPPAAKFAAAYAPQGPPRAAPVGSVDHWLTDRYRVFSSDSDGTLWAADIHHLPWLLQPARATFTNLDVSAACGLPLVAAPQLLHYVTRLDVLVWGPQRLTK